MSDVVIIGGGVVGLTTAYLLSKEGARVTVLDKQVPGKEASWAGAGMLPSFLPDEELKPISWMFEAANQTWPELSRTLIDLTGVDNEFTVCGALTLNREETAVNCQQLQPAKVREKFPHINLPDQDIYYYPDYAQVRNPRHLLALVQACEKSDVKIIRDCRILERKEKDGQIEYLETSAGKFSGDQFIVAAGAWTAELLRPWGYELEIKPIRGQILLYEWKDCPVSMILDTGKRYIVPRRDGHLLIGSTEENAGFIKENTEQGISELKAFAENLIPELKTRKIKQMWSGLRPYHAGKLPLIGKMPRHKNLWIESGHFRWGLQLSYVTAQKLVGEMKSPDSIPLEVCVN